MDIEKEKKGKGKPDYLVEKMCAKRFWTKIPNFKRKPSYVYLYSDDEDSEINPSNEKNHVLDADIDDAIVNNIFETIFPEKGSNKDDEIKVMDKIFDEEFIEKILNDKRQLNIKHLMTKYNSEKQSIGLNTRARRRKSKLNF